MSSDPVPICEEEKPHVQHPKKPTKRSHPLSPRSACSQFIQTASETKSKDDKSKGIKELERSAASVAKSIKFMNKVSSRLSSSKHKAAKDAKIVIAGTSYTRDDVNEMEKDLTKTIKSLVNITNSYSKKSQKVISQDELKTRLDFHLELAKSSTNVLAANIGMPSIASIIVSNANNRVANRLTTPSKWIPPNPVYNFRKISEPFFISDQLKNFILHSNFGNGLAIFFPKVSDACRNVPGASKPEAAVNAIELETGITDLASHLGVTKAQMYKLADLRTVLSKIVTYHGIITSPVLMSLMSCYINANGLKKNKRITIDGNMRKWFGGTNIRPIYNGVDVTPPDASPDVNKSAIEVSMDKFGDTSHDTYTWKQQISIIYKFRLKNTPELNKVADMTMLTRPEFVNHIRALTFCYLHSVYTWRGGSGATDRP